MLRALLLACLLALPVLPLAPLPALAVAVDEPLADAALEARARAIHKQLRCLVCQNQSIEDSNADRARDIRVVVRERIAAGDSDDEAIAFVVDRFGDWVLLKPPFKAGTLILWLAPALLLVLGLVLVRQWYRRQPAAVTASAPLSAAEQERLAGLLDEQEKS